MQKLKTSDTLFTWLSVINDLIDKTIGEISSFIMKGATTTNDGTSGYVPAPTVSDRLKFLRGDGTWQFAGGDSTDAATLGGVAASQYALKTDLPTDVDTVDGKHAADFVLASELPAKLAEKANTDFSNVATNIHYVVDSYNDGEGNWYRVYDDKFVEQGWNQSSSGFHTFLITYANNNFQVLFNSWYNSSNAVSGTIQNRNSRDAENIPRLQYGSNSGTGCYLSFPTTNYATQYRCVAFGFTQ